MYIHAHGLFSVASERRTAPCLYPTHLASSSRDLLLDIEKVAFAAGNSVYNPLPMHWVDSSRGNNRPAGNMQSVLRVTYARPSTFVETRSRPGHVLTLIPTTMG